MGITGQIRILCVCMGEVFSKTFINGHFFLKLKHSVNFGYVWENTKTIGRITSLSFGNHFEDFVGDKVSTGRFKNASEVIRAGLRLLEEEESKVVALKKAIEDGFESRLAKNFNAKKHLAKLKTAK